MLFNDEYIIAQYTTNRCMINNECVQEEKDYKIYNSLDAAISVALKIVV